MESKYFFRLSLADKQPCACETFGGKRHFATMRFGGKRQNGKKDLVETCFFVFLRY